MHRWTSAQNTSSAQTVTEETVPSDLRKKKQYEPSPTSLLHLPHGVNSNEQSPGIPAHSFFAFVVGEADAGTALTTGADHKAPPASALRAKNSRRVILRSSIPASSAESFLLRRDPFVTTT
jgi:hypothetical protein